ncbi:MAG: uracil-DNA glycosylase, partial [Bacteroidota bacterium]|nr:uracil-DNA glycosylase [Bacteroidota bacterium]
MVEKELVLLSHKVKNCTNCDLHLKRTNTVFGAGNPFAEILLIGEGPGRDEDIQGIPFVGKSGQLLDKILGACGFNRDEHVYIANIVKCRPPGNRDPK